MYMIWIKISKASLEDKTISDILRAFTMRQAHYLVTMAVASGGAGGQLPLPDEPDHHQIEACGLRMGRPSFIFLNTRVS